MVAWPCGIGSVTGALPGEGATKASVRIGGRVAKRRWLYYISRPVGPIRLTVWTQPSQDASRRRLILKRAFGARASEARDGFDSYPLSLRERAGVRGVPKPLDK